MANGATTTAPSLLMRPIAWIPEARRPQVGITLLIVLAVAFPFYIDSNDADVDSMANAAAYATLALGLNIVVGFAGLLDLGYAAFFAIGAYTYGILTAFQLQPPWNEFWEVFHTLGLATPVPADVGTGMVVHFTLSFWLGLPLAAALAAFFGVLFGFPTLRLRGDYLAIVTLGFGEIVPQTFLNLAQYTNGPNGISPLDTPKFFGYDFGFTATPYYYVALALIMLVLFVSRNLRSSRLGRAWMAIREDELAARHMGINTTYTKLAAFGMGASFSGIAGVAYSAKLNLVSPDQFQFSVSVLILSMLVLGGMGSLTGVVIGSLVLSTINNWLLPNASQILHVDLTNYRLMLYGFILMAMMLFRPQGLIGSSTTKKLAQSIVHPDQLGGATAEGAEGVA
jgi:branched-chain amino acid transport system permease protein